MAGVGGAAPRIAGVRGRSPRRAGVSGGAAPQEITKQINDKERVAAALENPNLLKVVEECILEKDY